MHFLEEQNARRTRRNAFWLTTTLFSSIVLAVFLSAYLEEDVPYSAQTSPKKEISPASTAAPHATAVKQRLP